MSYIPPTTEGWTSQKFGTNPGGYNPSGGHTGEDIAIPIGTPLVAMADGVVVHVGPFTGTYTDNPWWIMPSFAGFVVTVDYGEYLSHYAHCSGSPVLSGKRVAQGDVVAYSGNTGGATSGPHCHWEVMRNGWNLQSSTYGRIDPRSIIGAPIAAQGNTEQGDDFMATLTDDEKKRWLAACDRINGVVRDSPVLNIADGAYMNNMRDAQHAAVMDALGKTLNKDDGGYIVKLVQAIKPGTTDVKAVADALAGIIPAGIAKEVADELSNRLKG